MGTHSSQPSHLTAAEDLLFSIEFRLNHIRRLRQAPSALDDLIGRNWTPPVSDVRGTSIPPIQERAQSDSAETEAAPVAFEEQPTQAIDPEMAESLLNPPLKPPVRNRHSETVVDRPPALTDKSAPPSRLHPDSAGEDSIPHNEPPSRAFNNDNLVEARARSAAQIRFAQEQAETAVKEAAVQRRKDDDTAYQEAKGGEVAAIQITADGNTRVVRQSIAVGEADHDVLKEPPARTNQSDGAGGLQVDVLVPVVEVEEDLNLPELTDSAAPFARTQDLQIKEHPLTGMLAGFLDDARDAEARGDLQGAIQSYGDALDVDEGLEHAWLGRGRCRIELGDYAAALSDLRRAQTLSNGSTDAILAMGHLFYARKDYQRAIHYYGEVVDIEPSNAAAAGRRGLCHHYLGEREPALRDLRRAVELRPEQPQLQQSLQMVLQTGNTDD